MSLERELEKRDRLLAEKSARIRELEAQLEERTCQCATDDAAWCFACSECGKSFPRNELHLAHNHGEINYCPNCGRRVRSE